MNLIVLTCYCFKYSLLFQRALYKADFKKENKRKKMTTSCWEERQRAWFKVLKFLKTGEKDSSPTHSYKKMLALASKGEGGMVKTVWDDWRDDDIPCLPGWRFSIGRKESQRKIRYKSPEGKVFHSRGPLIRYLHENGLKEKCRKRK